MASVQGKIALALICLIVIVLSVAGAVADFVTRIELNIDGILLLLVCLTMGGLFSWMLYQVAKEQGWLPRRGKNDGPDSSPTTGVGHAQEAEK